MSHYHTIYKNFGKTPEEMRARRQEVTVELRKKKREELLMNRRNFAPDLVDMEQPGEPKLMTLQDMMIGVAHENPEIRFHSAQALRKMLSHEYDPPCQEIVDAGLLPTLVKLLDDPNSETQFETLWILTNVSSGTTHQTQAVVAAGAVPKLISLLQSKTAKVSDQAVWALGNIVGDGSYARDIAIANGVVEPILKMVHEGSQDALYRHNIAWLVSNLFRAKNPSVSFEVVQVLLPAVVSFLNDQNGIVVASACWSISYFTKEVSNVQAFINSGSLQKLVSLLDSQEESIVLPALRSIGHIVSGPDEHTDFTIKCNVLPRLASLLKASNGRICRDATWAISNIVSGTTAQIQKVIEAGVLPILIEVLDKSNCSCQHEAAWAITNITSKGTHEQIVFMVDQHQILKPFCNLMTAMKVETVNVVLGGLLNILRLARSIGGLESLCIKMEEIEAVDKLESLLVHDNEDVYLKAFQIIDEFFEHNDDHEDVPTVAPRNDIDNCIFSPPGPGGDGFFNF